MFELHSLCSVEAYEVLVEDMFYFLLTKCELLVKNLRM